MLQWFSGLVLGVILTVLFLAYQPQLMGDVQQGLHDARSGAENFADGRNDDVGISVARRFQDNRDGADGDSSAAPPAGYNDNRDAPSAGGQDRDAPEVQQPYDSQSNGDEGRNGDRGPRFGDSQNDRQSDRLSQNDRTAQYPNDAPDEPTLRGDGARYAHGDHTARNDARADRGPDYRAGDRIGAGLACRGSVSLVNRSDHPVEVRLHAPKPGDSVVPYGQASAPIALKPGQRQEQEVSAEGDCNRFNAGGGMTLEAEICPLDDAHRNAGCHTADIAVDGGWDTANSNVPERRNYDPRG